MNFFLSSKSWLVLSNYQFSASNSIYRISKTQQQKKFSIFCRSGRPPKIRQRHLCVCEMSRNRHGSPIGTTFWNVCEGTVKFNCSKQSSFWSGQISTTVCYEINYAELAYLDVECLSAKPLDAKNSFRAQYHTTRNY